MTFFPKTVLEAAENALQACRRRGYMLVSAESCTGGLIGAAITAVAGSSDTFYAAYVTYANRAKETLLGVDPSLIRSNGAVSEDVALAMAHGAVKKSSADVCVAVTGIAGPGGGGDGKPVGTVHIAVVTKDGRRLHRAHLFVGNRDAIREQSVLSALKMVGELLGKD